MEKSPIIDIPYAYSNIVFLYFKIKSKVRRKLKNFLNLPRRINWKVLYLWVMGLLMFINLSLFYFLTREVKVLSASVRNMRLTHGDSSITLQINPVFHFKPDIDPELAEQIKRSVDYASTIFQVPPELIYSVIATESSFNPKAVSAKGCIGLMQVSPKVWGVDRKLLFDPRINIVIGTYILRRYYDLYGSWEIALNRYSGGASGYVMRTFTWLTMLRTTQIENNYLDVVNSVKQRNTSCFVSP